VHMHHQLPSSRTGLGKVSITIVIMSLLLLVIPGLPSATGFVGGKSIANSTLPDSRANGIRPPITLTSPNAQADGYYGTSVANNNKYLVVGASGEYSDGIPSVGRAYLYNAQTGSLLCNFTSPHPTNVAQYGNSVGIAGSLVVVGAPGAGYAYVYNATNCSLLKTLSSPNSQGGGNFGSAVAIYRTKVIVGAIGESSHGQAVAGNAYEFDALTGKLLHNFTSSHPQFYGEFGTAVAIDSKYIAISAPYENSSEIYRTGNTYLFNASNGNLVLELPIPNPQQGESFGSSVAIAGNRIIVGAMYRSVNGTYNAGQAYVFNIFNEITRNAGAKGSTTRVLLAYTFSSPKLYKKGQGLFGSSVAINNNLAIVGAIYQPADHMGHAGRAYVFSLTKNGSLLYSLASPNPSRAGWYGNAASISGTSNLFVIGAEAETADGHGYAGHAYLYHLG
jgi:hypothetical protein